MKLIVNIPLTPEVSNHIKIMIKELLETHVEIILESYNIPPVYSIKELTEKK